MTVHDANFEKLQKQIEDLDIDISVSSEGVYTACSAKEPHFCFDGYSQAEVADRVVEALESYAKVYFGHDLHLRSSRQDVPELPVKIEASRSVSRLSLEAA